MDPGDKLNSKTPVPELAKRGHRKGALMAIELLFVLPLLVIVSLVILQFILIHTAYQRVQGAALAAAELAACGRPHVEVHEEAARVLGYLSGEFESELEYIDENESGSLDTCVDTVVVAVRIPMGLASTNYLGLLGASVNKLHVRSVVSRTLKECQGCAGVRVCDALLRQIIAAVRALEEAGKINHGNANSLIVKLKESLDALCLCGGDDQAACNRLGAFINEMETFKAGKGKGRDLTQTDIDGLIEMAREAIRCICGDDGGDA